MKTFTKNNAELFTETMVNNAPKSSAFGGKKWIQKMSSIIIILWITTIFVTGCGADQQKMKDGFYTAEMSGYSHGWKEYVCIMVKNDKIISAEFNAKNQSGYIKAWDNAYMKNMLPVAGTYPNEYTRYYAAELVSEQDAADIDTLTGATNSGNNFMRLSAAVIEQARKGNTETAVVAMESENVSAENEIQ